MSTSMLYHTFRVLRVQCKKAAFLAEKPFFTAASSQNSWSVRTADLAELSASAASRIPEDTCKTCWPAAHRPSRMDKSAFDRTLELPALRSIDEHLDRHINRLRRGTRRSAQSGQTRSGHARGYRETRGCRGRNSQAGRHKG